MWVVKDKGHSWDGAYFQQTVLMDCVILLPFLKDEQNVVNVKDTFLPDRTPCMKALATQAVLINNPVWISSGTRNDRDLNVCENLEAFLKRQEWG